MIFASTLNQMGVLGLFMIIGFLLMKLKLVPDNSSRVLSRLENYVFLPALVLGTFISNFKIETLSNSWQPLLLSLIIELIIIPLAILSAKLSSKDGFIRRMYTYGLSFSNFGFMGNAVVLALFPEFYQTYVIFTLPLWTLIYVWGVPGLLIEREGEVNSKGDKIKSIIKSLLNPMFIALTIGAIIGVTGLGEILANPITIGNSQVSLFVMEVIRVCGNCMSPIAMMLTGMTFAQIDIKKVLTNLSIYLVTFLRLIAYPLVIAGLVFLLKEKVNIIGNFITKELFVCLVCSLSMPLGLNTVVIPAAYGKDTSVPAGMALISHALSILTIPLIFTIFGLA